MNEQQQAAMRQALVDEDGENRAVRWFLAAYLNPGMTIGGMKTHLKLSGYPLWPEWAERCHPSEHLTKAGAQIWIRHLFALEQQPADEPVAWAISYDGKTPYSLWLDGDGPLLDLEVKRQGGTTCKIPLYTRPQPAAWVSLTAADRKEIERQSVYVEGAIRMTDAKLREKNGGKA